MEDIRRYAIIELKDIVNIDNELIQSRSLRVTADGKKTYVTWNGDTPECISALGVDIYGHNEMLNILGSLEWC